jgi:hypothetical protein
MSATYHNLVVFYRVIGSILMMQIMGMMLPVQAAEIDTTAPLLTVYKDANCGCCEKWLTHISERGFSVNANNIDNLYEFKQSKGIPTSMQSCHTAVSSQGFVFEGHIPAKFISRFLATPPNDAIGLTVPAMPVGSPGMEYQDKFMPYHVLLMKTDGSSQVYAQVNTLEESVK